MAKQDQYLEETSLVATPINAVEAISRAEFDIQVETAKRHPMHSDQRGLERFKNKAIAMATSTREIAESCLYALPRSGKTIDGRSIRLAEICAAAYGNMRYQARLIDEGEKVVTVQGVCHDLENNVAASIEVRRRITDRNGNRYNDDMTTMTINAGASIALRNAIFRIIPSALCDEVYNAARAVAVGDASTIDVRRAKMLKTFSLMGVREDRILARLKKRGIEEIDQNDLGDLLGLYNAIVGGEASVDETFPPVDADEPKTRTDRLKEALKGRQTAPTGERTPEARPAPATEKSKPKETTTQSDTTPRPRTKRVAQPSSTTSPSPETEPTPPASAPPEEEPEPQDELDPEWQTPPESGEQGTLIDSEEEPERAPQFTEYACSFKGCVWEGSGAEVVAVNGTPFCPVHALIQKVDPDDVTLELFKKARKEGYTLDKLRGFIRENGWPRAFDTFQVDPRPMLKAAE